LSAAIDPQHSKLKFEVDVVPCKLALDRAVVVGLIVNELVTNALKHGLPDQEGTIAIRFASYSDRGEGRLTVEDDGKGMDNTAVSGTRQGGMGTKLIEAFALQIGGMVTREAPERGSRVVLSFPLLTEPQDRRPADD
jgi:two-component sensor histidine kinase